jgi:hypothetical protein
MRRSTEACFAIRKAPVLLWLELALLVAGLWLATHTLTAWLGGEREAFPGAHRRLGASSLVLVFLPLGQLLRRRWPRAGVVALLAAVACLALTVIAG